MKTEFIVCTLKDIASSEKGSIISGPFGSNISSKFFQESGVPVIRGNNLSSGLEKFIDDGFAFISEEKADELNCYAIEDDLIFTAAGTIGQVGIIEKKAKYKKYVISNKQLRVRLDVGKVNPLYAYYWFSSPWVVKDIVNKNTGSTVPLINLGILKSLEIKLPKNRIVQDKIASVLSVLDSKIELNNRINAELEAMAKTIYDYWFVQFDFPFDFAKNKPCTHQEENSNSKKCKCKPYKSSGGKMIWNDELKREIPEGWEVKRLEEIANIGNESIIPYNFPDKIFKYYSIPFFDEKGTYSLESGASILSNKFSVQKSDILVSKLNPWFNRVIFASEESDQICSTEFVLLRCKKSNHKSFVYMLSKSMQFIEYSTLSASGTSHSHRRVNPQVMIKFKFPFNSELLDNFSNIYSPIVLKQRSLIKESQTLSQLRDWLLPMLMNGQVRVE